MGSVETWHSENDRVVRLLAIDSVYAEKMRKQIVAETIGWVRDIYVFHTTGSLPDRTLVENLRRSASFTFRRGKITQPGSGRQGESGRRHFLVKLQSKRSQGAVSRCAAQNALSNHFIQKGAHTAFSDWKFILRAHLNVLANNGGPWNKKDRSCRKCGHKNETLNHILNSCRPNLTQDTKRHDAIITEIARALPAAQLRLNKQVPGSRFNLRPDIVLLDESTKRACILNVQCPFDLDSDSLLKARKAKTEKYQCVAEELRNKGLRVYTRAVIIGSLGSFVGDNFRSFAELGIPKRQSTALAKKLVSQTIRHSRIIYNEHIHGPY